MFKGEGSLASAQVLKLEELLVRPSGRRAVIGVGREEMRLAQLTMPFCPVLSCPVLTEDSLIGSRSTFL